MKLFTLSSMRYAVVCLFLMTVLVNCGKDNTDDPGPTQQQPDPEPKPEEEVTFSSISGKPEFTAYQSGKFNGKYPGVETDYELYFGEVEIAVDKVSDTNIKFVVPSDVKVGTQQVKLIYKSKEHMIGEVKIKAWNEIFPADIGFIQTEDVEHPVAMRDSMNNSLIPHISEQGPVDRVLFTSGEGVNAIIELNELGLPGTIYTTNQTLLADGYDLETGTVNVGVFPNDDLENATYSYALQLDLNLLQTAMGYHESMLSAGRSSGVAATTVNDQVGAVAAAFSITGCIVRSASLVLPDVELLGSALVATDCGAAIYRAYQAYAGLIADNDNIMELANSTYGNLSVTNHCSELGVRPSSASELNRGIMGCYTNILDDVQETDDQYDEFVETNGDEISRKRVVLKSGFGDIKVTLSWDTDGTDIDLWVTEPDGNKIYYGNPVSTTGGELDVDNTYGYGPENIFWPTNQAPAGEYFVQVHYYGGSGVTTNYTVTVVNEGVSRTYTGALEYNQVADIVTFDEGGWSEGGPGRIAAPERKISIVKQSDLKPKVAKGSR